MVRAVYVEGMNERDSCACLVINFNQTKRNWNAYFICSALKILIDLLVNDVFIEL